VNRTLTILDLSFNEFGVAEATAELAQALKVCVSLSIY
jgi:hypothetical protein